MSVEPKRPVLLVADDDADILQLVTVLLARGGYDVVPAADGEAALRLLAEHRPDLAILDVMMAGLDGYELTRAIRAREETREMPVILLTARVQEEDRARGFAAGADEYVKKPFVPRELTARVEALLVRRRSAAA